MINTDIKETKKTPKWELPEIFSYKENVKRLLSKIGGHMGKKIIVIGNGGSVASFEAYRRALPPEKQTAVLRTMDFDCISKIKKEFSPEDSAVFVISKSGENIGPIETAMLFLDYEIIAITEDNENPLREIAKKMKWQIIKHPAIGGRFSGGASPAIAPSIAAGINAEEIISGIKSGYLMKEKPFALAEKLFNLEKEGITEVFVPIYSPFLFGFGGLIEQLMRESVCKNGKGQTVYFSIGPESQHHTNQRVFGGRKNICVLFVKTENNLKDEKIYIPEKLRSVSFRGKRLGDICGIPYSSALRAEYLGTKKEADRAGVPNFTIFMDKITPKSVGEFTAFLHLLAFYSAKLRKVNPFDQPEVERSKDMAFKILANEQSAV